ncbi:MAG: alanine--glyoxylate aminotransferase family protein [Planctomycetes bacterium]|nr:alanine--glyoxylate aminotransferase family protein [Planctomycetota bacterium]
MHKKLFIPGPTEVSEGSFKAMSTPMIGHRMKECSDLIERMKPKLKKLLFTDQNVFLVTSSASGMMEAALRNCVTKRVLVCTCGAFSERWYEMAALNSRQADAYRAEWGKPNLPEKIDEYLASGKYDAVALVHNETSTGVMNPIEEIAKVIKKYEDVQFLVDSVSSMSAYPIKVDELGIDVLLAGTQKAFALPPGLTVAAVSERAIARAKTIPDRGYYFNFPDMKKYDEKYQTPNTPAISMIFGLDYQLERFFEEGLNARFQRHRDLQKRAHEWGSQYFELFAPEGYRSVTLTVFKKPGWFDTKEVNKFLATRGFVVADGYGDIKDATWRLAHMGDTKVAELDEVIGHLDEWIRSREK